MATYRFLKEIYNEGPVEFFAVDPDRIESMRVSNTYLNGQNINASDAGDSVVLNSEKAVRVANDSFKEFNEDEEDKYSIGDNISDYDDSNTFSGVVGNNELEEDIDYTYYAENCKGFNYWDGNNWSSVIVEYENEEAPFEFVDIKLSLELNKAIEEMEFIEEGFGKKTYKSGDYQITLSQYSNSWEDYSLINLNDIN